MSDKPQVIEAQDLERLLQQPASAPEGAAPVLLLQITSLEVFTQARLPGALLVQPGELVCGVPPATGRLPDADALSALFGRIGLRPEHHVVVFDDEGGGWAGRMAWTLDVIGHGRWSYLNGGLQAWHGAGLPLQGGSIESPGPGTQEISINFEPIAEVPDVLAAIEDSQTIVWDVRSVEEYRGERQAAARVGHIPGAVNRDWMLLKNPDQTLADNLQQQLTELGLLSAAQVITHCQTHHRSGLSYMIGRLYGLNIKAYHGSWSEWGNRDDTPINTGPTP